MGVKFNSNVDDGIYSDNENPFERSYNMKNWNGGTSLAKKLENAIYIGKTTCTFVGAAFILYNGYKLYKRIENIFTENKSDNRDNKDHDDGVEEAEFTIIEEDR